ncbi:MAG: LAGLIDADG family homing endonuclease [Elusimicrobiota bacterium]
MSDLHNGEPPDTFSKLGLKIADNNQIVIGSEFYYGGEKPVIKIKTDLGIELSGTPNHKVKVIDKNGQLVWKQLSDLTRNDYLTVSYGSKFFGNQHEISKIYGSIFKQKTTTRSKMFKLPYKITTDLARLIGYIVADGSFNVNSVAFTRQNKNIVKDYISIFMRRFNVIPKKTKDKRRKELYNLVVNGRNLVEFFSGYIGTGRGAANKKVPKCIKSSGKGVIKNFIKGLTLDGYISKRGRIVAVTSVSKRICSDVQMLLLNLGIVSRVGEKKIDYKYKLKKNEKEKVYEVSILPEYKADFLKQVGFAETKKSELSHKINLKREFDNTNSIPCISNLVKGIVDKKWGNVKSRKLKEQLRYYNGNMKFDSTGRDKVRWLLDICPELSREQEYIKLREIIDRKIVFNKLTDIRADTERVYDLYVPNTNSFIGNGFVNHNTVNFPLSATPQDVEKVYILAYNLGCKGVTVYRDKSREKQVLNVGPKTAEPKPRIRPQITHGMTVMIKTGCGKMYVTINEDLNGVCEIFSQLGKSGGCTASQAEAISRLISLSLRSGILPEEVISQLRGIRCPTPMILSGYSVLSCADGIARAIEEYIKEKSTPSLFKSETPAENNKYVKLKYVGICPQCPECNEMLVFAEGCIFCRSCGYSRCM